MSLRGSGAPGEAARLAVGRRASVQHVPLCLDGSFPERGAGLGEPRARPRRAPRRRRVWGGPGRGLHLSGGRRAPRSVFRRAVRSAGWRRVSPGPGGGARAGCVCVQLRPPWAAPPPPGGAGGCCGKLRDLRRRRRLCSKAAAEQFAARSAPRGRHRLGSAAPAGGGGDRVHVPVAASRG